ncbi:MAG TPA: addiction module toxin RelE [Polaromonas sp.]|uniref:type II toxin-antitoxin system RelE/ParE family toxin n=1 Tax=Polaromonas sp. UBA4122 TaxID=1947074 RepID=UPI000EDE798B|nr:type II toxin-antitoxin system RelE/ParE family toxin [Polaromonas sp. UBA4122]HAL39232.1 addiction module toxin RelE [Polaromonas sp.]
MKLLVTASFVRATKKLHKPQKAELDSAVLAISTDPEIGESKVGDLFRVRIYKFWLSNQLCLLAYRVLDDDYLKLLTFGSHENFYRDLKKLDN